MCGRSGGHATHCRCCSRCRPRPSAPLEFGKSASTRPLLHAARIARGDMCMHMCMWAPRGRLISISCVPGEGVRHTFRFWYFAPSSVDTVVAMPASLRFEGCSDASEFRVYSSLCSRGPLSRATLPLLDGVHIAIFIRAKHKGYVERDVRRVHELSCTIVAI